MVKQAAYTYTKMNQDVSKSKHTPEVYYEGKNIRILTNESFGSITNQLGNTLKASIPDIPSNPTQTKEHLDKLPYPLTDAKIVGSASIDNNLYLLSKYPIDNEFAKLFYAQKESGVDEGTPYIDSNIRILVEDEVIFEDFSNTEGAVEGPSLPVGTNVRVTAFSFDFVANEPAPDPTLYLEVYKNGVLIETFMESLPYTETITIHYDFQVESNTVYFFQAYSLPEPGPFPNPFTEIDIFDYIVDDDIFTIHKLDKDYNLSLEFIDEYNIGDKKVDVKGFFENENVQKLYWANGKDTLSFINIADPNSLELDKNFLSIVPSLALKEPQVEEVINTSSSHTSGAIQYAYNLYKVNGAQSKLSPLSEIVYLGHSDRGADVNVPVDKNVVINIEDVDTSFDRIRVYSIKYSSLNSTPEIKIIYDLPVNESFTLNDDNNSLVSIITLPEFLFIGGEEYIPKHLIIKDNHLFLANYETKSFDIDFDARAYRYDTDGNCIIKDSQDNEIGPFTKNSIPEIPEDFDAINPTNKALEQDEDWNKYVWKEYTPGDIVMKEAEFDDIFELIDSDETYAENCYDEFDNPVDPGFGVDDYCVASLSSTRTFKLNHGFTIDSIESVDFGSTTLIIENTCDGETQNVVDRIWNVFEDDDNLVLEIQDVHDSRCASVPEIQAYRYIVSITNGTDTYDIEFDLNINKGSLTVVPISDIDMDEAEIEVQENPEAVLGGVGPNVEFEIKYRPVSSNIGQSTMLPFPNLATNISRAEHTSLKSGEVYRLFLEFQTDKGNFLFPKWIADVKIPEMGTVLSKPHVEEDGTINYIYIETKLLNIPQDSRIKGWRTSIVERTEFDKTVVSQGIFNPDIEDAFLPNTDGMPSYLQRTVRNSADLPTNVGSVIKPQRFNTTNSEELRLGSQKGEFNSTSKEITSDRNNYFISISRGSVYTPETIADKRLVLRTGRMRKLGLIKNTFSQSFREVYDNNNQIVNELNEFPTESNLTTSQTNNGASLLTSIITDNTDKRIKMGKLISDNHNVAGDKVYSVRKHAFTRYFGGISYISNISDPNNNMDISGRIAYTSPIQNIFNINQPDYGEVYRKSGRGSIGIQYENSELTGRPYNFFGGSAISVVDIINAFMFQTISLPPGDTDDYGVLVEFYRSVPNQYGGDTYTARQLNRTIPYSNTVGLEPDSVTTEHQGDTFIQKFNFLKTFKAEDGHLQISEIVSFPVETTVNLDLRWDILKNRPDNFDADELTSYGFNRVYEQQNNTVRGIPKPFNFSEINRFPVNIIPSKVKTAGEIIDSFTDFLVNDVKTLDGQYGEITGLGEHNDNIFSFQREAVAHLAINPRVQLSGSDGIPIELGSGRLIERYQYINTNSGTLNKWSIVKTKNGLMYFDLLNSSINFLDGQELSTVNGLYNKLLTYSQTNKNNLEIDDILAGKGVHAFYDNITEDIYFTFLSDEDSFTIGYNGLAQGFVSYYDFTPSDYFKYRNRMLSTIDNGSLWKHNEGEYQNFYGQYYPASVTILANPDPYINKIFNNIGFKAETYLDNADIFDKTFNKVKIWNEYQDSGETDLLIKRKFRNWNAGLPRHLNSRDRINNPWSFIQLKLDDSENNYKVVLHDLIVSYL